MLFFGIMLSDNKFQSFFVFLFVCFFFFWQLSNKRILIFGLLLFFKRVNPFLRFLLLNSLKEFVAPDFPSSFPNSK